MDLFQELQDITVELNQFYEMTINVDEEGGRANWSIKQKIKNLIVDAHSVGNLQIFYQALELLRESTGCAEDYEIFIDIAGELVGKNILSNDEVKKILEISPVKKVALSQNSWTKTGLINNLDAGKKPFIHLEKSGFPLFWGQ